MLDDILYKFSNYKVKKKHRTRQEYFNDRKLETKNKRNKKFENKIDEILHSNIDFSKFGWVGKVAKILNIQPQKVNKWIKEYMIDFYNEKCFKRK